MGHREQACASALTHTVEGNLSLTRILNGCAEARTVGTHYSTTHPPPLRQNSTSPPSAFLLILLFPPRRCPRWSRATPSSFHELFLAAILLSLSYPGPPVPPPFNDCFFPLAPPSVPSLPLPSFSQRACVHPVRTLKVLLCVRACM